MSNNKLTLIIQEKKGVIFSGDVKSVSSNNEIGPFDILPQHENFVAVIKDIISFIKIDGKNNSIKIERGIIRVKNNQVNVYLGI